MTAYLMVQGTITDQERWKKYREAVLPLVAQFGGKHVVRGGAIEALEGSYNGRWISMFEFSSLEAIHTFWNSPDYVPVKELRRGAATLDVWAVPGA